MLVRASCGDRSVDSALTSLWHDAVQPVLQVGARGGVSPRGGGLTGVGNG